MNRIEKSPARKLADLEDHLFFLHGNLSHLKDDLAHYKPLATELRVLICLASRTEGLLWRLVDEYNVSDAVRLHVAGLRIKPDYALATELSFCVANISRPNPSLEAVLPSRIYSFRKIVKNYEAAYLLGESYTHEKIIRSIAEQMGSAHEDNGIELPIATMEKILINGIEPYVNILAIDAEITLEIGERVLAEAERNGIYTRQRNLRR